MTAAHHRWVLSGGLASGKSQVRRLLEAEGVPTIDADLVGHEVIRSDGPAFSEVAARWPHTVDHGEIDRAALAEIVFADRAELETLEGITHPHIFGEIVRRVEDLDSGVVVEMPLLGRLPGERWRMVIVDCRDEVRMRRAIERGMTEADARARMSVQPSRAEWLAFADVVVPNHSTIQDLRSTVGLLLPNL